MLIRKKKINKVFVILLIIFSGSLLYLLSFTPGLKGDIDQTLRILLKQPILLKGKPISDNLAIDYSKKIFYALKNRLFNQNDFEKIKIDIAFSELKKLKLDRKNALNKIKIDNRHKIKVNLTHNGKRYKATARLKGDLSGHWGNAKQWSLRIKLKDKKTIYSMNEFSISVFIERDFPYNYIISDILKEYGILAPRYKTVNIFLNGDDWGLMLIEEQFSDSFYTENKIKEAPIFKMTNENDFTIRTAAQNKINNIFDIIKWQGKLETKIFNEKNILNKSNIPNEKTNENLISIFKNFQEIIVLEDPIYLESLREYTNISSLAKVAAITAVFGDAHSTASRNSRYYINPYDLKIEPILTDSTHKEIDEDFFKEYNILYKNIFHLENFQKTYIFTLNNIKNNFFEIENKFYDICQKFGKNCQNLVELDILKKNIDFLINQDVKILQKINISKVKAKNTKKFNTKNINNINKKKINLRAFDDGEIFIDNFTSEKIHIKKAFFKNKIDCNKDCKEKNKNFDLSWTIKASTYENLNSEQIKINLNKKKYKFLEVEYIDEDGNIYSLMERIEKNHLKKENFFKQTKNKLNKNVVKKNNNYIFNQGIHLIDRSIVIPNGYNLIIKEGTTLKMSKDTYIIIENGFVKFQGKKNKPIRIIPLNNNQKWKGIYVNSNSLDSDTSILEHVNVSGFSYFNNGKIQLTGGLNFINSRIKITNSIIENSFSEDAINIVNSNFKIDSTLIRNSISDGIDIDFGKGEIINTSFYDIKGDAIDLSGSDVILTNIVAKKIYDKAISAGEQTMLNIKGLKISSSGIGIASKDSSKVKGSNIEILECGLFDLAVFQKKQFFSGGSLVLNNVTSCNSPLIQKGSLLSIDGKEFTGKDIDIEKLYNDKL